MERAEVRERQRAVDELAAPAVEDLERVGSRRGRWRTGRRRPRAPRRAAGRRGRGGRRAGRCRGRPARRAPGRPSRGPRGPIRRRRRRRARGRRSPRAAGAARRGGRLAVRQGGRGSGGAGGAGSARGGGPGPRSPPGPGPGASPSCGPARRPRRCGRRGSRPSSSETSTRAPARPLPVFMSWAKTRTCSRDVLTIASRSLPRTRVVAWSVFSSRDLHDVHARQLQLLQLVRRLDRLVLAVARAPRPSIRRRVRRGRCRGPRRPGARASCGSRSRGRSCRR